MTDKKIDNLNYLIMPESDWELKEPTEKIKLIKKLNLEELNEKCLSGFTRLHRDARWTNYSQVISAFKDRGANMNVRDSYNRTPLHWAAGCNDEISVHSIENTIVQALLNAGAKVNAKDDGGRTPLHLAMLYNRNFWGIVEVFLKNTNIDINIQDNNGCTPLHFLAIKNETYDKSAFFQSIKLLVKNEHIDCTIKDNDEKTAFDYAMESKINNIFPEKYYDIIPKWREKSQAKSE